MASYLNAAGAPSAVPFSNPDPFAPSDPSDNSTQSNNVDEMESEQDCDPKTKMIEKTKRAGDEKLIDTTNGSINHSYDANYLQDEDVKNPDSRSMRKGTETSGSKAVGITSSNDASDEPERLVAFKSRFKSAARKFHLESIRTSGVSSIFNPTVVRIKVHAPSSSDEQFDGSSVDKEVDLIWRARDNRRGRYSIAVSQIEIAPRKNWLSSLRDFRKTLVEMFTSFPYWDMAFWSGWSYTIGSALFVIDGVFSWGPLRFPSTEFPGEATYAVPLCFFFGALFYQIGAVAAYLEAVNDGSFHGSAMRRIMDGKEEENKKLLDKKLHAFFGHLVPYHTRKGDVEASAVDAEQKRKARIFDRRRGGIDMGGEEGEFSPYLTWRWYPTWEVLRTHHIYEIGYLACTIQLIGVTLYGITAVVILPGILDSLNEWQTNFAYWIPQIVAAACFLIASIMFMLEMQDKWYKPAPQLLGWWVGVWSMIGSLGFELSAGFGPTSQNHSWAAYQSSLSSMWGSAAYLIGSFLQWYEAVNKNPEVMIGI